MSGLEQTFYIMAIVYMCLMFLFMIAALGAILAIKAKINAIHSKIEEKLTIAGNIIRLGQNLELLIAKAKKVMREHHGS